MWSTQSTCIHGHQQGPLRPRSTSHCRPSADLRGGQPAGSIRLTADSRIPMANVGVCRYPPLDDLGDDWLLWQEPAVHPQRWADRPGRQRDRRPPMTGPLLRELVLPTHCCQPSFSGPAAAAPSKLTSAGVHPRRRNLGSCRSTCLIATARHVVAEACSASKLAADAIQQSTLHARHREIDLWHRGAM